MRAALGSGNQAFETLFEFSFFKLCAGFGFGGLGFWGWISLEGTYGLGRRLPGLFGFLANREERGFGLFCLV